MIMITCIRVWFCILYVTVMATDMYVEEKSNSIVDWTTCIICGKNEGELKCPAARLTSTGGVSDAKTTYSSFIDNVAEFRKLDKLPVKVSLSENITCEDLLKNSAKWHKNCYLKFTTSKLQRAQARCKGNDISGDFCDRKSRRLSSGICFTNTTVDTCIFCSETGNLLHDCSTLELDKSLREKATELQDTELLSRIAAGDLVAIEAKYHDNCRLEFNNRYRSHQRRQSSDAPQSDIQDSKVFIELTSYIENHVEEGVYIFKLSDLNHLFQERFKLLGIAKQVNRTRLKQRLLEYFSPNCQEQTDGKNTLLVFNEGMQQLLKESLQSRDFEQEALSMARVSKVIRREISDRESFTFSGSFPPKCEEESVPESLKSLISMLLYGPNIKDKTIYNSRACLTICQLILFNFKGKQQYTESKNPRHEKTREPPLPLYVGLDIHSVTRSKKLVNELCDLGISINYNRVLEVEDSLTSALCQRYNADDLVCPSSIRHGLFTMGALDNIDHNPTATTAKGSFHGTSISIFQVPSESNPGTCRETITIPDAGCESPLSLPDSYSIVPAVSCNTSLIAVPQALSQDLDGNFEDNLAKEHEWVNACIPLLDKEKLEKGDYVAWSAYHASLQTGDPIVPGISTLLPLFHEKAATVAMVRHGMTEISRITERCNPGQLPVMAVDQPLFALAKFVQWNWPNSHGENKFIVMLGGLHIEIALWRVMGDLLEDSGWTEALTDADIASSGTADSFLCVSHLTKTRHAHQVTSLALAKLQTEACNTTTGQTDADSLQKWKDDMLKKSPQFKFWDLILRLELLILSFVRAHRECDFSLYVNTLESLAPFFFILDHTNYARWVPVHIRDMKAIPDNMKEDFQKNWVFPKTSHKFSTIPLDQAHEQNNKLIKDSGGAVGLTEKPAALKRWMIAGPEQVRLLAEFQGNGQHTTNGPVLCHEQGLSTQETFKTQVTSLFKTIASMANPFLEDSGELMRLDTHDCMDNTVKDAINQIEDTAKLQYDKYVKNVLVDRTKAIQSPIKKNKLPLFKRPQILKKSKVKEQAEDLRSDYGLFSQLFIASQVRDGDLDDFFSHENHSWPPSISQHGNLRLPKSKSEVLDCFRPYTTLHTPQYDTKVFDGAGVVHSLPRVQVTTFGEYSQNVFLPWTLRQLQSCRRIDIVWDTYLPNSLKEATRENRGKGIRRKVAQNTKLPQNFMSFLRNSSNKEELFAFLSADVASYDFPDDKEVYITAGQTVVTRGHGHDMPMSNHEEADTRICLHVKDAVQRGSTSIMVSTVDSDIVVILLGIFSFLRMQRSDFQLWVEFGKGKDLKFYNINLIYMEIGEEMAMSLPLFHAFTGCDTTSQFGGKGKKTAWKALKSFPGATAGFSTAARNPFVPFTTECSGFRLLESYTCVLYDNTTHQTNVNDLRQEMFAQGKHIKLMESLPPTQAALLQHTNRSLYQASIWMTSLEDMRDVPPPVNFGWAMQDGSWKPFWTTLPEAATSSRELIRCGCKANPLCSRKCVCKNTQLHCTPLCGCKGNCKL